MNRPNRTGRVFRVLCMAACFFLAGSVLMFGKQRVMYAEQENIPVPAEFEKIDGDLDFLTAFDSIFGSNNTGAGTGGSGNGSLVPDSGEGAKSGTADHPVEGETDSYRYEVADGKTTILECFLDEQESIRIPTALGGYPVTCVGDYAFYGMESLKDVTFPNTLTEIATHAFEDCTSLSSLHIPPSVTTVRDSAFCNLTALTAVEIPATVTNLEDYAFFCCDNLADITISTTKNLQTVFELEVLEKIKLEEGVTSIEAGTFEGCSMLTSVSLPTTLKTIKESAFYDCSSLTELYLPEGLVSIGESAFEGCTKLKQVVLPESLLLVSDYAFYGCEALELCVIPERVSKIGLEAFENAENLLILAKKNSVGEEYAVTNGIRYEN